MQKSITACVRVCEGGGGELHFVWHVIGHGQINLYSNEYNGTVTYDS